MNQPPAHSDTHSIDEALRCWYLTGPTASGKTRIGVRLAERLNAEIISLDSMAIYIGMDIGTAKPSREDRKRRPHHMIDIRSPNEEFSLAEYIATAHQTIREIRERGHEVLFVGGTPLYLKSLLRGIHEGPPPDWEFRKQVEKEVERVGTASLLERLRQVDPLSAAKLHRNDTRRIIRALEVYKVTGQPISHQQTHFDEGRSADECRVFTLSWPRVTLHHRIEERVERMFEAGFVDEVRSIRETCPELSRTAAQAVGYREIIDHLQDQSDLTRTIESVKARTRQFARRQETWFRHLSECQPIDLTQSDDPETIVSQILQGV